MSATTDRTTAARAYTPPSLTRRSLTEILGTSSEPTLQDRVVVVAMDDSAPSHSAVRIARSLALGRGMRPHALHVLDNRSAPMPPPLDLAIGIVDATVGPAVHSRRVAELRDQVDAALGEVVSWEHTVCIGNPAAEIARRAGHLDAALIVMGLRTHGRVDRVLRDETTLNTMRLARCPVLGVASGSDATPRRVMAAVDFSVASVRAVLLAGMLLASGGSMHLVYVAPDFPYDPDDGEAVLHDLGVQTAFGLIEQRMETLGIAVDHVVLHRDRQVSVAESLLEHAEVVRPGLICVGSVSHSQIDRWMVGSVSTELVRGGRYSVLAVRGL